MDEFEASPVEGTEGAFSPFFSPDGQWIGYITNTQIRKISVLGGTPQTLTEAGNVYGVAWGSDNTIVFAEQEGQVFSRVSADGGVKRTLLSGTSVSDPEFLPGGRGILLTGAGADGVDGIILFISETGKTVPLIERGSAPHYVPSGHIVYSVDGSVLAVPFDLEMLAISGPAVPVLDGVRLEAGGLSQMAFSTDGWLAYVPGSDMAISTPVWLDRSGVEELTSLSAQRYGTFRLSPDGSRVALVVRDPIPDVWIFDFQRATTPRRLTVGVNADFPIWSPDGHSLSFGVWVNENRNFAAARSPTAQVHGSGIFQQRVDGGRMTMMVADSPTRKGQTPYSWGSSNLLVFSSYNPNHVDSRGDIWVFRPDGEKEPEPFVQTPANEWGPFLSPDGRFIAYTSDESGQYQVYVKPYPPTEIQWRISDGYGEEPVWSAVGDEIFYRRGREWLSVPVQTDPSFEAGVPRVVFDGPYINVDGLSYDVTGDGQRFFLLKPPDQPPPTQIHVVANWFEELKRLAPSD